MTKLVWLALIVSISLGCAWAEDQAAPPQVANPALDKALSEALDALATGDGAKVARTLCAQANEVLVPKADGFVALNSTKLEKTPSLAAPFKDFAGYQVKSRTFSLLGAITSVRASLVKDGQPDRVLSAALTDEGGSLRYLMLALLKPQADTDPATVTTKAALSDILNSWASGFPKGDISPLQSKLNDDPFSVAVASPDGQFFAFGYPDYFIGMVNSFLAMGAADYSAIEALQVDADGSVAIAKANWNLSMPNYGQVKGRVLGHFCKTAKGWRLIGMVGGASG